MRIVSLLPSATEIVFALGLDDQLLGVTDECDWPAAARAKRVVVRSRQPAGLTPGEIDEWVRAEAPNGGLYRLDDAAIAEIAPELLLTQDLCRVCAVPTGDVDAALARIGCPASVVTLEPQRLEEVIGSVGDVAEAAGEPDRGRAARRALNAGSTRSVTRSPAARWCRRSCSSGSIRLSPPATGCRTSSPPRGAIRCSAIRAAFTAGELGRGPRTDPDVVVLRPCGMPSTDALAQADELVPAHLLGRRVVAVDLAAPGRASSTASRRSPRSSTRPPAWRRGRSASSLR